MFEVVVDALKRATNVDDKQIDRQRPSRRPTSTRSPGHITWKARSGTLNPVPNVCRTVLVGGQWVKGTKYPFDLHLVDTSHAAAAPFNVTIPETGKLTAMSLLPESEGRSNRMTEPLGPRSAPGARSPREAGRGRS